MYVFLKPRNNSILPLLIQFQLNSDFELEIQKECSGSINMSIGEEFHVRHRAKGVSMKSCKKQ